MHIAFVSALFEASVSGKGSDRHIWLLQVYRRAISISNISERFGI